MIIKTAEFLMSNSEVSKCPKDILPEYAFIGRSNVGKSSLINMLTDHKNLAKTSGRPGKTQLINHFLINKNWFLVDLPGYGYADYFEERQQLALAFVLVDIRHEPQKIDLEFLEYMGESGIPFTIIFTKADKLKPRVIERNVAAYMAELLETWEEAPKYFITSSSTAVGRDDVLAQIDATNTEMNILRQK